MPAQSTAWAGIGDITALGTTALTQLGMKFEQFSGGDATTRFFPEQRINASTIIIEREIRGVGVAPLVEPNKPDVLTDNTQVERKVVQPAYSRESDYIPQNIINDLRQIGTLNEQHDALAFVARRVQRLTERSQHLFRILRTQALLGAMAYTDIRTKKAISVSTGIPAANLVDLTASGLNPNRRWGNLQDARPITDLQRFRRKIFNQGKVMPRYALMSGDLVTILEQSFEILMRQEAFNQTGYVTFSNSRLTHIAGLEIMEMNHVYQAPDTMDTKKLWPINKVVITTDVHPDFPGIPLGHMAYTIGENPGMGPGMWVRTGPDSPPPSPPGRSIQLGNSGLPYINYPEWIGILTVDTPWALRALVDDAVTNTF